MKVYQLARMRMNQHRPSPMPPGGQMAAADKTMLDGWLGGRRARGHAADATCMPAADGRHRRPAVRRSRAGATPRRHTRTWSRATARLATSFKVHGGKTSGDNTQVHDRPGRELRAVLLQRAVADRRAGHALRRATSTTGGAPPLAAVHDRHRPRARLPRDRDRHAARRRTRSCSAAGRSAAATSSSRRTWACELPPAGPMLNVQWHFYNNTPGARRRRLRGAGVHRAARARARTRGALTWLGTENFNGPFGMPPGENRVRGHLPERLGRRHHDLGLLAAHARARPPHEVGRDARCGRA